MLKKTIALLIIMIITIGVFCSETLNIKPAERILSTSSAKFELINKGEEVDLPFKRNVRKALKYAGIGLVENNRTNTELTVRVVVTASSSKAKYSDNKYHYTSAQLQGSIFLELGTLNFERRFFGDISPYEYIYEGSFMHSSYAPYSDAFENSSFIFNMLVLFGEIFREEYLVKIINEDNDIKFQTEAARILSVEMGLPGILELLFMLESEEEDIRALALETLSESIYMYDAFESELMSESHKENIQKILIDIIYSKQINRNYNEYNAVNILGYIVDEKSEEALIFALEDNTLFHHNNKIPVKAAMLLENYESNEVIDALIKALHHSYYLVRNSAVIALRNFKSNEVALALIGALNDPNIYVRDNAILSLRNFDSIEAPVPDALIKALKDSDKLVRAQTAIVLGNFNSVEASAALIDALDDPYYSVRANAATSLGKIKDPSTVRPLKHALNDSYADVRQSANDAIKEITGKYYLPGNEKFINRFNISGGVEYDWIGNGKPSDGKQRPDWIFESDICRYVSLGFDYYRNYYNEDNRYMFSISLEQYKAKFQYWTWTSRTIGGLDAIVIRIDPVVLHKTIDIDVHFIFNLVGFNLLFGKIDFKPDIDLYYNNNGNNYLVKDVDVVQKNIGWSFCGLGLFREFQELNMKIGVETVLIQSLNPVVRFKTDFGTFEDTALEGFTLLPLKFKIYYNLR